MKTIIALAGKAGSGKNSVADILDQEIGDCVTFAHADRIRWGMTAMFDVPVNELTRAEKEAPVPHLSELGQDITPRRMMQDIGSVARSWHPDLWLHLLWQDIAASTAPVVIITDCRYPNEVERVRREGGVVWWVERDGIAAVRPHASENSIGPQDCDRTIANLGTLEDLAVTVEQAWAQLEAEMAAA